MPFGANNSAIFSSQLASVSVHGIDLSSQKSLFLEHKNPHINPLYVFPIFLFHIFSYFSIQNSKYYRWCTANQLCWWIWKRSCWRIITSILCQALRQLSSNEVRKTGTAWGLELSWVELVESNVYPTMQLKLILVRSSDRTKPWENIKLKKGAMVNVYIPLLNL